MFQARNVLEDAQLDQDIAEARYADWQRGDGLSVQTDRAVKAKAEVHRQRERDDNDDVSGGGGGGRDYTVADGGYGELCGGGAAPTQVSDDDLAQGVRARGGQRRCHRRSRERRTQVTVSE